MALEPLCLSDFDLGGPLGTGATSHVYAATHRATGRGFAVKMLEPSHRNSAEMRTRLQREAIMLAGVQSPHVGKILGFGHEEEQPFLVLEHLRGETIADLLKREGRVTLDRLSVWIEQLLVGVRDCHNAGVIHRDLKPANIFLEASPDGGLATVKIIDFGVARLKEIAQQGRSLTSTHHLLGSMAYMAPEQFQNAKRVGPQTDVYAVGVVIFRSLAGRLPFVSRSFDALIKMKAGGPAPVLSSMPGVGHNELLDAFVQTSLAPHPSSRFDNGQQMLEAWWRVAADLDREEIVLDDVDIVFEFEDDIQVSTDVVATRELLSESAIEIDATNVTGGDPDATSEFADEDDTGSGA